MFCSYMCFKISFICHTIILVLQHLSYCIQKVYSILKSIIIIINFIFIFLNWIWIVLWKPYNPIRWIVCKHLWHTSISSYDMYGKLKKLYRIPSLSLSLSSLFFSFSQSFIESLNIDDKIRKTNLYNWLLNLWPALQHLRTAQEKMTNAVIFYRNRVIVSL